MTSSQIITAILATLGGGGALIIGLGAWLGKIWSSRIIEKEKAGYQREIELLKSSLAVANAVNIRNSQAQFNLYIEVWNHLQDLKSIGDRLWERVSREELEIFSKILTNARFAANRGRLILLERHYQKLRNIFDSFENYQIGKKRLIEIRTKEEFDENFGMASEYEIHQRIRGNEKNKREYEELLDEIMRDFRKQLGLNV
jgi:hypothetical protein